MERIPRAIYTKELRGSSKAGNGRWTPHTGGGEKVIGFSLDHTVLGQGEQRGQA